MAVVDNNKMIERVFVGQIKDATEDIKKHLELVKSCGYPPVERIGLLYDLRVVALGLLKRCKEALKSGMEFKIGEPLIGAMLEFGEAYDELTNYVKEQEYLISRSLDFAKLEKYIEEHKRGTKQKTDIKGSNIILLRGLLDDVIIKKIENKVKQYAKEGASAKKYAILCQCIMSELDRIDYKGKGLKKPRKNQVAGALMNLAGLDGNIETYTKRYDDDITLSDLLKNG